MKVEDNFVIQTIHEVPNGGLIMFDVDSETHLGIKAVNPPHGPYIITLKHPDYKGTPGLWAYGVATSDAFLYLKDAVIRPNIKDNTRLIYNHSPKPGHVVKTANSLLLTIRTNRSTYGYVDLKDGQLYDSLPAITSFQILGWTIYIERKFGEELLFEYPMIANNSN